MNEEHADPAENITRIRAYVDGHGTEISQMVNKLNQDVLGMNDSQRDAWRKSARPALEKKLDDYAHAQLNLRNRLNESQKWELGEILARLK